MDDDLYSVEIYSYVSRSLPGVRKHRWRIRSGSEIIAQAKRSYLTPGSARNDLEVCYNLMAEFLDKTKRTKAYRK